MCIAVSCCSVYCSVCCSVRCGELRRVLRMSKEGSINSCEMPLLQCVLPCLHIHKRAPQKSPLYISAKEPYMYPQKKSIHIRKRALFTSAKEPYMYLQKSPIFIRKSVSYISAKETCVYLQKSRRHTRKRAQCVFAKGPYMFETGSRVRLSDSGSGSQTL